MLSCKEATQLLSERLERPLDAKEKVALTLHTAMCPGCRRFGNQMEEISNISKAYLQKEKKEK
ncbi:zf-HC2 domain-containing protein [Vibrio sp. RC27]